NKNDWRIDAPKGRTVHLDKFSVLKAPEPPDGYLLTYRAQTKASELQGKAYLEMVCEFEDGGQPSEAYSRGVMLSMTGTTDWASLETSFRIEKGGRAPDKFKFNVAIEGKGTVWIKDIELLRGPLPK